MPATITLATIDYGSDYSDYAWAAGGGIARPAAPAGRGGSRPDPRRAGGGSWWHSVQISACAPVCGVLWSIGINTSKAIKTLRERLRASERHNRKTPGIIPGVKI